MSVNGNLQEQDIVAAIQQSSDEAFVLKQDLEDFKISLSVLAPRIEFEAYEINNRFVQGAQTVATDVRTQVIQNLSANVLDAATDPNCPVKEKAEEAASFLKKLAKHDFALDTDRSMNDFSTAIQKVATALEGETARLDKTARDDSKIKQLSAELAELKKKKADAVSKKPAAIQELLNKDDIGNIIDKGNKSYDDAAAKGGKAPSKNPLASVSSKFKELSGQLPTSQSPDTLREEIDGLSARITETEGNIYAAKQVIEDAKRNAIKLTSARESLGKFEERFEGVAKDLKRLQEVVTFAEVSVQDYNQFLGTEAANDKSQLKAQTDLLALHSDMLGKAEPALAKFVSRVVA